MVFIICSPAVSHREHGQQGASSRVTEWPMEPHEGLVIHPSSLFETFSPCTNNFYLLYVNYTVSTHRWFLLMIFISSLWLILLFFSLLDISNSFIILIPAISLFQSIYKTPFSTWNNGVRVTCKILFNSIILVDAYNDGNIHIGRCSSCHLNTLWP